MAAGEPNPFMRINEATGEIYYINNPILGTPIITPKPPEPYKNVTYTLSREDGENATRRAALKDVQRLIREFHFTLEEIADRE